MNLFAEQKQTPDFEKLMVNKGDRLGGEEGIDWGFGMEMF